MPGLRKRRAALAFTAVFLGVACTLANPLGSYGPGRAIHGAADATPPVARDAIAEGAAEGAAPSWNRYAFDFGKLAWAAPVALDTLWTGPNAAPPTGIATAVELVDFDRLILFADDGKVYVQAGSEWLPPTTLAETWGPLAAPPLAAFHVPYAFLRTVAPDASLVEGLTFISSPNASEFEYDGNDQVRFDQQRPLTQDDGGAPPGDKAIWSFEMLDLGNADPAQRYKNFTYYEDGRVYEFWADASIRSAPLAETVMWNGKAGAPTGPITAAYFDQAAGIAYFIGP